MTSVYRSCLDFYFLWIRPRALGGDDPLTRGYRSLRNGDCEKAITCFCDALRVESGNSLAYALRANAYLDKREFEMAIADASAAIGRNPQLDFAFFIRAGAYQRNGRYAMAIADLTEAIRLYSNDANYFHHRGVVFGLMGDSDKAVADQSIANRLDPLLTSAHES